MSNWPLFAESRPHEKDMPSWSYQLKPWPNEALLGESCPTYEAPETLRYQSIKKVTPSLAASRSSWITIGPQQRSTPRPVLKTENRTPEVWAVSDVDGSALYIPQSRSVRYTDHPKATFLRRFRMARKDPVKRLERVLIGRIRTIANEREMHMSHLAGRAGISRSGLWEVMNGRSSPTLDWLQKVAEVLEVDPIDLLQGKPVRLPSNKRK